MGVHMGPQAWPGVPSRMPSRTVRNASWDGAVLAPSRSWCIRHVDIIIYRGHPPISHSPAGRLAAACLGALPHGRPGRRNHPNRFLDVSLNIYSGVTEILLWVGW